MKKSANDLLLLTSGGILAGLANGLLGAGGGIIIVFVLSKLLREEAFDSRDIFANSLCVMFPLSLVSTLSYGLRGNLDVEGFGIYILPALLGGIVGGILLGWIGGRLLRGLFSAIMLYSGVMLMVR